MPSVLWRVCVIACLAALVVTGVDWGLPSARPDATLFATHPEWDGRTLAGFDAERVDTALGSDVDRNPIASTDDPVTLNATDADRAAIVRRYRLFSHQPDEMITFMALQQMSPADRQFDPRLYQYGGTWVYGVGGLLKAAGHFGLIDLRPDKAFYYDHPDAFGRFYVVARLYTLAGYVLLMTTAGMILWRLTGSEAAAAVGAAVVGGLPVVFALAHEAKPHVGGAALILATALAGARFVRTGRWRDALLCGGLAGLAAGTVLSAVVAVAVPLTMVFLPRPRYDFKDTLARRIAALVIALFAAGLVYAATNPYVVLHAVRQDAVLKSNLANTKAMYGVGLPSALLADGAARLIDALSWPAAALAVGGLIVAVTRRQRTTPLGVLLAVPTGLVLLQFFAFAAGKPAEYARFALLPAASLGILGVWALSTITRGGLRTAGLIAAPLAVGLGGTWPYVSAFAADAGPVNTRTLAADALARLGGGTLDVVAEPAPYATPAVDLWAWRIELVPPRRAANAPTADVVVRAVDDPARFAANPPRYRRQIIDGDARPAPITWANKPFELLVRDEPTTAIPPAATVPSTSSSP